MEAWQFGAAPEPLDLKRISIGFPVVFDAQKT